MTVTPKSVGVSGGPRGARISANSGGRVTRTVGIPGSGISHTKTMSSSSTSSGRPRTRAASQTNPDQVVTKPQKPGTFAPRWEKELYDAVVKRPDRDSVMRVAQREEQARTVAAFVEAVTYAAPAGEIEGATQLVSWLNAEGFDPHSDPFVAKYLGELTMTLAIASEVTVQVPADRDGLALLLAELFQSSGRVDEAIEVIEDLTPSAVAAVSLAELYAERERWSDVIALTDGVRNRDEPATYLLIQRGRALREQGFVEASREALKEALRVRSRPAGLRHRALVERARTYLAEGKRAMARKDLERVLAENATYPGLSDMVSNVQPQ
jgi:tetratricopeptide (TPR) repeat protein